MKSKLLNATKKLYDLFQLGFYVEKQNEMLNDELLIFAEETAKKYHEILDKHL